MVFEPEYIPVGLAAITSGNTKPLTIAKLKTPVFKSKKLSKFQLPTLEFEPEFIPVGIAAISSNNIKSLTNKNLTQATLKAKKIGKLILPKMEFEPEFIPVGIASIATKPNIKTFEYALKFPALKTKKIGKLILPKLEFEPEFVPTNLASINTKALKPFASKNFKVPVYKGFNIQKTILPQLNFEPEVKMEPLASVFPSQFRISFPPKSSDSIRPMRLRKLSTKPNDAIANLIARIKKTETPKTKPTQNTKPVVVEEEPGFKVESSPSELSQIAVYFTDGKGKFYQSKPMVSILDGGTKAVKQKFMRDVFKNGEPEPVDLKVFGNFDVAVLGQKDIMIKNVLLEKNKLNKVIIVVNQGTLQFAYRNNRELPVKFEARITKRWIQSPTFTYMKCDETKVYDPGEYYVEINTMPPTKLHTEISFGAVTEIQLAQDGAVVFTNQQPIGDVTLYFEDGDSFSDFLAVKVNGPSQALFLKPGLYKAEFIPAGLPKESRPIIVDFKVEAEKTTNVELKNHNGLLITPNGIGTKKVVTGNTDIEIK